MANEKTNERTQAEMDAAAVAAERELRGLLGPAENRATRLVLAWFVKNYMKAGHKRLGRVMVKLHKEGI